MTLIRFGVIRAFDSETYLADVELHGYLSTLVQGVPVAYHVREDLVTEGTRCVVLFLDALNPSNAVVLALFGGPPADPPTFEDLVGDACGMSKPSRDGDGRPANDKRRHLAGRRPRGLCPCDGGTW